MCWTKHVVPRVARTGLGLRGREGCVTDSETLEPGLALVGSWGPCGEKREGLIQLSFQRPVLKAILCVCALYPCLLRVSLCL